MLSRLCRAVSIVAVSLFASSFATNAVAETVLTHHLHQELRGGNAPQPIGKLPAAQVMQLDIVLPLRDQAALDKFVAEIGDPNSPNYRQFLSPAQFAAVFGPSQADYDTTVAYLKANGFTVTGGEFLGREIQVKAPVSVVESTFHVAMNVYQHPYENRTFYSPDREPTTSLPFPLWHITGLDNFATPHMAGVNKYDVARKLGVTPDSISPKATTGSGPSASYLGSDMRAAYYTSVGGTLTGTGQNLGIFFFGGIGYGLNLTDLATYYTNAGQTYPSTTITALSTDGTATACNYTRAGGYCDDTVENIELTQALGMAPNLATIISYVGNGNTLDDTAMLSAMVTHYPLPTTIANIWAWNPDDPTTDNPYFQQMIAQGQNFLCSSGDDSNWGTTTTTTYYDDPWPGDDPYVVVVGGTSLTTASAGGAWQSEKAWGYASGGQYYGSGGGISPNKFAIPAWQSLSGVITSTNKGSTVYRDGPDVAANADFTFYSCANQSGCTANVQGGTEFPTAMWAGYLADINQGIAATSNGGSTLGFLNPVIYPANLLSTYPQNFHDITTGTSGIYSAVANYDLVTGWGSPGSTLAPTLIGTPIGTPTFFLTAYPTSYTVPVSGPVVNATPIGVASRYGFTGTITYTAVGTGGLTCSMPSNTFTSANVNTTLVNTLSIATAGVTTKGTYTCTLTGTSGSITSAPIVISVVISSIATASFTLTPATASYTLTNFNTIMDTITATSVGSFAAPVTLSCAATGGITCSMGTSPVTLTAGGTATSVDTIVLSGISTAPGTYVVTVTGVSTTPALTETTTINIISPGNTFTLTPTTTSYSIASGTPESDNITTTSVGLFAGTVALTCTPISGITCTMTPSSATLTAGGSATPVPVLAINTTGATAVGSFPLVVTGVSGTTTVTTTVTVNITSLLPPAYAIVPNTYTLAIASIGGSATDPLTLNADATFSGTVNLACAITATPANVNDAPTCSVAPNSAVVPAGGSVTGPVLTIGTTAAHFKSGGLHSSLETRRVEWLAGGLFLALLLFPLRRRRLPLLAVILTALLLSGSLIGCSGLNPRQTIGSSDPGTTLGAYTVTVIGTPANSTSSPVEEATITLTVN
jgi:kumamolisin